MLAGCFPRPSPEVRRPSLKDDMPKSEMSVEERARAEQWQRCGQRHVDYHAGKLNETPEQKRTRDEICAELHRDDHAR